MRSICKVCGNLTKGSKTIIDSDGKPICFGCYDKRTGGKK